MPERNRRRMLPILVMSLLLAVQSLASGPDWRPPGAGKDDADWIGLASGEWLRGRIGSMYEGKLDFHSDSLGAIKIPWKKIRFLWSSRVVQVAFLDRTEASGKLRVEDGTVRIDGEAGRAEPLDAVLALTVGEPRERNYWSGRVRAGLNARSGNTDQFETNLLLDATRRSPLTRLRFGYLGNLTDTAGERTADNHRATAVWERFVSDRFYLTPLDAEFYRDPFQNIAGRETIAAGLGWELVRAGSTHWSVNGNLGFQHTNFQTVPTGSPATANTPSLTLGTRYETRFVSWLGYLFDLNIRFVDAESGRLTHHLRTGFDLGLLRKVGISLFWVWDHIQEPQPGKNGTVPRKDDFRTILSVGYNF